MSSSYPGGARLMIGFDGKEPTQTLAEVLRRTGARSVILFARNVDNARQTQDLIASVRELVDWPLLIAVDQEGGAVVRVTSGATVFPGNMALGAADDPDLAYLVGRESGRQLSAIGFDLNLGPVVDLQTNPANPGIGIRSFGAERERAAALARYWIRGHLEAGVACCLKHFPGKGAASVDAHIDLPVLDTPLEDFREPHVAIFQDLFDLGPLVTLMTTHVLVRALDPELPATLSPTVLRTLLRGELGFDGLVISDDLEMGAIEKHHGVPEAALAAAIAGHDCLPICHRIDRQLAAGELLQEALDDGRIDAAEHDRSIERIEAIAEASTPGPLVSTKEGDGVAKLVADRAIHVFDDEFGLLPITESRGLRVIAPKPFAVVGVEESAERDWGGLLARCFKKAGLEPEVQLFDANLEADAARQIVDEAGRCRRVVLLTWNARGVAGMRSLLEQACLRLRTKLVVAHLRNPFDQALVPDDVTALTSFGYRVSQLEALASVIAGAIPAQGRMPAPIR